MSTPNKQQKNLSKCCNANLDINYGEEGTNCYVCGKCGDACDVIEEPKEGCIDCKIKDGLWG